MARLHVFVDGTWLYKACGPERVLASKTERPDKSFAFSFERFGESLLKYASQCVGGNIILGERYLSTSIFDLPTDFDSWPLEYDDVTQDHVERTKRNVLARERFVQAAIDAGYNPDVVYRPRIKSWMVNKLIERRYQEKQVDTTVVALLVKSAITNADDIHAVISGDADMLPAIRVAYPQYSKNVFVVTTHPDELLAEHRQSAFSLANFRFDIAPYYFQDHVEEIMSGEYVYVCAHCHAVFSRSRSIPQAARPCCIACHKTRT